MITESVRKWIINAVEPGANILAINSLKGGASSSVYEIKLSRTRVGEKEVVLRQFDNAQWLQQEPDLAKHEKESLLQAAATEIPTPKIIACDEKGQNTGLPAVLMTKLKGEVELKPQNIDDWLRKMAESLAKIHALEAEHFSWSYSPYNDISNLEVPPWSDNPEDWKEAIKVVQGPRPKSKPCFIHRDFHPTNILWTGNEVSGIVDWVNACRGPAGIDVGHCRLNLAMLYGASTADDFLAAYQQCADLNTFRYNPYWDILALIEVLPGPPQVYPGWSAFGVTDLTSKRIMDRLTQYVKGLLNQKRTYDR